VPRQYRVTLDHFTKYQALAIHLRVSFNETALRAFGFTSYQDLAAHQSFDPALERLSPALFDSWCSGTRVFNKGAKRLATFELICLAKHCLLTQVLGAAPYFTRENRS